MNDEIRTLFEKAVAHHQAGELTAAEPLYRAVIDAHPDDWNALYLLGTLLLQLGRWQESIDQLQRVAGAHPEAADAHNNLGVAWKSLGRWEEAARSFQAAIRANPDYAQAFYNLGSLMEDRHLFADAEKCYRHTLNLAPEDLEARASLGNALKAQGKWSDAEECYRAVRSANPRDLDSAVNLGFVLVQQQRLEEAATLYEQILETDPGYYQVQNNLGYVYERLGRFEDSIETTGRALRAHPDYPEGYNNLGTAFRSMGAFDEACDAYEQALRLRPDFPLAEFNLATTRLLQGRFAEGWPGYERRAEIRGIPFPTFPQPRWDGTPLAGKTILVHTEQGLGDTIQFIRYARVLKDHGATVAVECPPRLERLLSTAAGIDHLIPEGSDRPPFDVHVPLLSVPSLVGTTHETIPAEVPYLAAEPERVDHWRTKLEPHAGFRVGLCWQGSPQNHRDYLRSIPLAAFAPLAGVPGVSFISLQKGPGEEQLTAAGQPLALHTLGPELDKDGAFVDTAAVMQNLDLIITCDTSIAHLAGALGLPVWVVLPRIPEWRWLLDRSDSPWYPTMRLFRQPTYGDWPATIVEVKTALQTELASREN